MGAVAYAKLMGQGIDIAELKRRNEATKGKVFTTEWFRAQITLYEHELEELQ